MDNRLRILSIIIILFICIIPCSAGLVSDPSARMRSTSVLLQPTEVVTADEWLNAANSPFTADYNKPNHVPRINMRKAAWKRDRMMHSTWRYDYGYHWYDGRWSDVYRSNVRKGSYASTYNSNFSSIANAYQQVAYRGKKSVSISTTTPTTNNGSYDMKDRNLHTTFSKDQRFYQVKGGQMIANHGYEAAARHIEQITTSFAKAPGTGIGSVDYLYHTWLINDGALAYIYSDDQGIKYYDMAKLKELYDAYVQQAGHTPVGSWEDFLDWLNNRQQTTLGSIQHAMPIAQPSIYFWIVMVTLVVYRRYRKSKVENYTK